MSGKGRVTGKSASARRRKLSRRHARQRRRYVWTAAVAFGLLGIVAVAGAFAFVGGGGGESGPPESTTESSDGGHVEASPTRGPAIDFAATEVNLGLVPLDTSVSHAFDFMNVGDDTLRVENVDVKVLEGC
jgi:hypothetical protein